MMFILIAIVIAAIMCGVGLYCADRLYSVIWSFVFSLASLCVAIIAIIYAIACWNWLASSYRAGIINREYGTNYSREEVFFAADVIETIRQLDRKRIEVNGDLLKKEVER